MSDFEDDQNGQENGGQLRKKLEDALAVNKALTAEVTAARVEKTIRDKGLTLVKPEDLEGVALDKIEEKAAELHEQRKAVEAEIAKQFFAKQGFEGDELDEAVKEHLEGKAPVRKDPDEATARAFEGVRSLGSIDSTSVGTVDLSKLDPAQKIAHGLESAAKKRR